MAQAREERRPETAHRARGQDGIRNAETLRFPGFYASPRMPLDCGAFFRKSGTLAAEVSQKNFPCDTSSTRVVFLRQSAPHGRPSHFFNEFCFSWLPGLVLLKTDALALEALSTFFFATPLGRQSRFSAKACRTAATASVLRALKRSFSLQPGPFWLKIGPLVREVL